MCKQALKKALLDLEEIEGAEWISADTIMISLRYPRSVKVYLKNPTVEKTKERIGKLLRREIQLFLEPEIHRNAIEPEETEVRKEESNSEGVA